MNSTSINSLKLLYISQLNVLGFVLFLVKIGLGLLISLFLIMIVVFIFQIKNNKPLAILNEKGIWLRSYKFIPWEYIDRISEFQPKYAPLAPMTIAIWIKKNPSVVKKLSWQVKAGIFFSKFTGYQHITFGTMRVDENLKIIKFAQKQLSEFDN